jgi:ATP-dependent Clp protease ATP-binding subunit ClpA
VVKNLLTTRRPLAVIAWTRPFRTEQEMPDLSSVPIRYDRFTSCALSVMRLAQKESKSLGHEYLGILHILLALAVEKEGRAGHVLRQMGAKPSRLRREMKKFLAVGPRFNERPPVPQTPEAARALKYAMLEAHELNHAYVGTSHLLLGLLRELEDPPLRWFDDPAISDSDLDALGEAAGVPGRDLRDILRKAAGIPGKVLRNLGLQPQDIRREVLARIGHDLAES